MMTRKLTLQMALLLTAKVAMLEVLYLMFFSPAHHPPVTSAMVASALFSSPISHGASP